MADGSGAQGTLVITWPAFVAADGTAVAPGSLDVTLGTGGALDVALTPNAGANPPNTYYTVVYQLQPSEVRTEYWVVPTSSPATLAQVRTTPGSGTAAPPASEQYVNTALAGKANDNAVVHLANTETITGTKSFIVPPNVPTPVNTGDVANKAYVDNSVAGVGAGSYLPTAGGTMSGTLTLSGNPTAPLQAAPKQYVDSSTAAKADLVSGLVPTGELGSGVASALNCLLGNGTWGSCGSSANATEIQSVPVGSAAPSNGQVLTYSSSSGQYAPANVSGGTGSVSVTPSASQNIAQPAGTQFSVNNLSGIRYVTPGDNWLLNPTGSLAVGANTVTLTPCPRGLVAVSFANAQTYVYISGVGTPEAALITASTCTQAGGSNGTITFTAVNSHGSGYAIGSASQGVQEAINAAPFISSVSTAVEAGTVVVPPGQYTWQAPVTVPAPSMTVDFAGSIVTCNMAGSCLIVGSTTHQTYVWDVTISDFTGQAGCNNCNFPMIEDAGQKTRLIGIGAANPNPIGSQNSGSSFGSLIQVDNDQAAVIDGFSAYNARWYHCTTAFCSVAIKGAGGSGNAGLMYIKNANMNLNCGANGVDNQNANTLRISDSVIQSQAQFAVRSTATYSNEPNVELDNVYGEVAGCAGSNPLGIGEAGLIVEGGFASVKNSTGPVGSAPVFANTGPTQYNYYIVAHSSTYGYSAPFLAGIALTNGSGSIAVAWPQFGTTGTVTYDVVRTTGAANGPAPYTAVCGGGTATTCGAVATGLTVGSSCAAVGATNICTFTDTASSNTASYTVTVPPTYWPALPFWNGSVIYTTAGDAVGISPVPSGVHFDRFGDNVANSATNPVSQVVSSFGSLLPKFFAQQCVNTSGGAWLSCGENEAGTQAGATLLQTGAYNAPDTPGEKGRLIFEQGLYGNVNGGHKITLVDSNPAKTLATAGMRPNYDANDTYIGLDNAAATLASGAQLAFGAPVSISHYIGNVGDNANFLERLTATAKTFNVPVNVSGTLTVNGQLLVAGPWMVSSPIPGTAMAAAGAGTSALGISNDGNFYISANAGAPVKVATAASSSYFSNLFQEDGYDLGQYVVGETTTNPQNLHVYSSYTNSSTWQRTSLGYDGTDNYAVVRSENSASGTAPGLGLWVNSGLKWVVDASSNWKPWTDQTYNIGTFNSGSGTGLRPGTVYVAGNSGSGSGFELGKFASESYELCNDATSGTVINGLAVLTTGGCAAKSASALGSGAIGVVIGNAGTTGVATLARTGSAYCSFDGTATVVGDYVVPSSTANSGFYPLCHDAGATRPTGTQILGRVLQASAGSTTVQMFLDMPGSNVSSSGAGTGTCTNQAVTAVLTGGPTCTTITSAYVDSSIAPAASPALTGTPTAPTAAANTNTTQVATTAFVLGQASSTTPNMDGTGAVGTSNTFARADHVHPTDTSRAPLASPGLTGTPTAPTAAAGDNSTKIATTAYVRAETYLAWSCAVAGTTAVTQYCNWTVPAGITVTGFDVAASTAAAGCTTYPVLQVWDGTASAEVGSYSTTFSSGTNFYTQVTGSANVASGHALRLKITTAAVGCSTNAGGVVATVTYQMQN
jgi:hypothetical protein